MSALAAPKCGEIARAVVVEAEPNFKSLNRYFLACDCEPRQHHREVSRREFRIARNAGTPMVREPYHPWNGSRRTMTLDKWLRRRRAKKSLPAQSKKMAQLLDEVDAAIKERPQRVKLGVLIAAEEAKRKNAARRGRAKK